MRWADLGVIVVYLLAVTWFGTRFRSGRKSLQDYFLGGRNTPWWAIALSIVSAETSTLTIVGTPALSFAGDFRFLQIVLGYLLARVVISTILLPQYFRGHLFTAYQLMDRRFGGNIRRVTAVIFLITRSLAEGVRVFAVSIIISIVLGTGETASVILIVGLTLFYTFEGGMTAVIWTDVVQMGMYVLGAALSLFVILGNIHGGWGHVAAVAGAAHKFRVFDFQAEWSMAFFARSYSFWAGVLGGCFLTTASHGTDQLIVQRLLSAKSERDSRAALMTSWLVVFCQFALFLLIGVALFVYYQDNAIAPPKPLDRVYPKFVWDMLPVGVAGMVMAAILAAAMANLSAALNSLASTTVIDFPRMFGGQTEESPEHQMRRAKWATAAWSVVLVAIGLVASHWGSVLVSGLSIASVTLGILLGVFLLGVLTRRPGQAAAITGVVAGLAVILYVTQFTPIAFTWWVLIGSLTTFGVGYLSSFFYRRNV
jgi:SSS family solute:Na+ symporter